jgi:hypothetical protein
LPGLHLPSDPQRFRDGSFLVVDYETPGRLFKFTAAGNVLWSFGPASGPGELHNSSLAAPLPNGLILVVDDFADRVVMLDLRTERVVWQYGVMGVPGSGPGHLRIPDGADLLYPDGSTPLHVDFTSGTVVQGRP